MGLDYRHIVLLLLCQALCLGLGAQDSLRLQKNFKFTDGIYYSFESFQRNQPDASWEEVQASVYSTPQNFMAQVEYIQASSALPVALDSLWGICLGGIPYVRLPRGSVNRSLTVFAGLRLRGKICYFNYENEEMRSVEMPVYIPNTDFVFRRAWVDREETILYEKILHFETGEVLDFNPYNLRRWIGDDERLVQTLDAMNLDEVEEKLFKCLLIYVDRNPVNIKTEADD